jgi:hypothetical protein
MKIQKLAGVKLNSQIPTNRDCPDQPEILSEVFFTLNTRFAFGHGCDHSSYVPKVWHHAKAFKAFHSLVQSGEADGDRIGRPCRYVPKIVTISRICRFCGRAKPPFQAFTTDVAIPILAAK